MQQQRVSHANHTFGLEFHFGCILSWRELSSDLGLHSLQAARGAPQSHTSSVSSTGVSMHHHFFPQVTERKERFLSEEPVDHDLEVDGQGLLGLGLGVLLSSRSHESRSRCSPQELAYSFRGVQFTTERISIENRAAEGPPEWSKGGNPESSIHNRTPNAFQSKAEQPNVRPSGEREAANFGGSSLTFHSTLQSCC